MIISSKISKAANDPLYCFHWLRSKISSNYYLRNLKTLGHDLGLQKPTFLLSFDCDTTADIEASFRLYKKFSSQGIYPTIAAPADIIEEGLDTFLNLLGLGANFLNHGSKNHAAISSEGKIYSTLSYSDMSTEEWTEDIIEGHQRIEAYLGIKLKGFRTPHFGEFTSPSKLKKLYTLLSSLGYSHSSSTLPLFASIAHRSKNWSADKITEFPVNGLLNNPTQIIDSWSYSQKGADKELAIAEIVRNLRMYQKVMSSDTRIFLNIYFDPAQLETEERICTEIMSFSKWAINSYEQLLPSK